MQELLILFYSFSYQILILQLSFTRQMVHDQVDFLNNLDFAVRCLYAYYEKYVLATLASSRTFGLTDLQPILFKSLYNH